MLITAKVKTQHYLVCYVIFIVIVCYCQTSVSTVPHSLTVHTAPGFTGGIETSLGKESPSGSSHSSTAGSGSGPYQVDIVLLVSSQNNVFTVKNKNWIDKTFKKWKCIEN